MIYTAEQFCFYLFVAFLLIVFAYAIAVITEQ